MTQHHSLEPQVHRQNKGWIKGILSKGVVGFYKNIQTGT